MRSNAAAQLGYDAEGNGDRAVLAPRARNSLYTRAFDAAWRYAECMTKPKEQPLMTQHGHFHWNELRTRNAERAKQFYSDTIGWTFQSTTAGDGSTYWIA